MKLMYLSLLRRSLGHVFVLSGLICAGCTTLGSSVLLTGPAYAPTAAVAVSAFYIPPGATQIGVVEAHGTGFEEGKVERVLPELIARVGQLGGNLVKIDRVSTRFTFVTQMAVCGQQGQMCAHTVEVPICQIEGRALRFPVVQR